MTTKELTALAMATQGTSGNALLDYFHKMRADRIKAYKAAIYWVNRRDARNGALHYGKLIRLMEGQS